MDAGIEPNYQFYLDVDQVVFPEDGTRPPNASAVWKRDSLVLARRKDSARLERSRGYTVTSDLEQQILSELTQDFGVELENAKVLPESNSDLRRVGKYFSDHPLHKTFFGREWQQKVRQDELYERAKPGGLVPEFEEATSFDRRKHRRNETQIKRISRVFTVPLQELEVLWADAARQLDSE